MPSNYWKNVDNQLQEIKRLEKVYNIKNWQDWYKIKANDFNDNGL